MQSQTIFRHPLRLEDPGSESLEAVFERVSRDGRDVIYTAQRRLRTGPLARLLAGTPLFPQVLWQEPHGDALLAGLGAIVSLDSRHPEALGDLASIIGRCQAVAERHPGPDAELHRIYGGFAFDPGGPVSHRFPEGWPVRFMLPEISLRQRSSDGDQADVAIRVKVLEGTTIGEVRRRVDELAARLEDWRDAAAIVARARARRRKAAGPDALSDHSNGGIGADLGGNCVGDHQNCDVGGEFRGTASELGWRRPHPRQGRDRWFAAVERVGREIEFGGLGKLVLSRDIDLVTRSEPDAGEIFEQLAASSPGTYRYLYRFDEQGAFLGASPERLLALAGDRLEVSCLAGTAQRGATPEEDGARAAALASNPKEAIEHDLVVEAVLARLRKSCGGIEWSERPDLMALPTLYHLHTPIRARLSAGSSLGSLVADLHPTPAVGGIPAHDARPWIRLLEGRPRGWYGGAVGWIGAGAAELAVAIRCITLHPEGATITVGAGIVTGSTPQGEWDETECKAAALLRLLEVPGA